MRVLGANAIFHDPSAAMVVDGNVVAAAEEERFSRGKHGKRPVPFAAWGFCQAEGVRSGDLDVTARPGHAAAGLS